MLSRSYFYIICVVAIFIVGIFGNVVWAKPEPVYPNGYNAKVLYIYDGDTFTAQIFSWPQHSIEARVRLRGIDTPEIRGKCASEKTKAQQAKETLAQIIPEGSMVMLYHVELGTYAGRIIADVITENGDDVSEIMLEQTYARPYTTREGRKSWCNL